MPSIPPVLHSGLGINLIAFQNDLAGWLFDPDADGLFARVESAGIADNIVSEHQVLRFAAHADAGGFAFDTVVFDHVIFQSIAVAGHALGFVAEVNAVLIIGANLVFLQEVVAVFVADGNAVPPVVLQNILLKQPVPDPPTQIKSILPIAPGNALADNRALRT